jgi:hypothetical protein
MWGTYAPGMSFACPTASCSSPSLLFSLYDGTANPVQPRTARGQGVRGKIANNPLLTLLGLGELSASPVVTTLQIQQFITTAFVLSEAQRRGAYQTYLKHRQQIVARWTRSRKEE